MTSAPPSAVVSSGSRVAGLDRRCHGRTPAAGSLLELLAFFAPDALPLAVLGSDPEVLPEELRDDFNRDEAVAALNRFSLLIFHGYTRHPAGGEMTLGLSG